MLKLLLILAGVAFVLVLALALVALLAGRPMSETDYHKIARNTDDSEDSYENVRLINSKKT